LAATGDIDFAQKTLWQIRGPFLAGGKPRNSEENQNRRNLPLKLQLRRLIFHERLQRPRHSAFLVFVRSVHQRQARNFSRVFLRVHAHVESAKRVRH
jgi:hypothetical protein